MQQKCWGKIFILQSLCSYVLKFTFFFGDSQVMTALNPNRYFSEHCLPFKTRLRLLNRGALTRPAGDFFVLGGCPLQYKMFSGNPILYPLDANSIPRPSSICDKKAMTLDIVSVLSSLCGSHCLRPADAHTFSLNAQASWVGILRFYYGFRENRITAANKSNRTLCQYV